MTLDYCTLIGALKEPNGLSDQQLAELGYIIARRLEQRDAAHELAIMVKRCAQCVVTAIGIRDEIALSPYSAPEEG